VDPDMAREMAFRQDVWFENKIANIEYAKQVDIFPESNRVDICTVALVEPVGFRWVERYEMWIS
jgi:hypothetical protein